MKFEPIHQHVLIKATMKNVVTEETMGKLMLSVLVKDIRMKAVTEPQCVNIEEEGNEGLTGSINLATSHIAFHIWNEPKLLMLDVYSCKPFEINTIIKSIEKFMVFESLKLLVLDRDKEI